VIRGSMWVLERRERTEQGGGMPERDEEAREPEVGEDIEAEDADELDPEPLAADLDDLGELVNRDHEPNEVRYGAPPPG
jgi:hypothetical protein